MKDKPISNLPLRSSIEEQATHNIRIPSSRPPLREPIVPTRNPRKGVLDIIIQLCVLPKVDLEPIIMTLRATRAMPNFCPASDDKRAIACTFQGDGTVDRTREDARVRRAFLVGLDGTAGGGVGCDACGSETGLGGGLAEGGAAALFDDNCADTGDDRGSDGKKSGELLKQKDPMFC
jgi:hypothetical protein